MQSLLHRIRQPAAVPLSLASIRQTLAEFRAALRPRPTDAAAAGASNATPADVDAASFASPSTALDAAAVSAFCSSQGYATLVEWIWRPEVIGELANAGAAASSAAGAASAQASSELTSGAVSVVGSEAEADTAMTISEADSAASAAEDVLCWFAAPFPATDAFLALVAATKAVAGMRAAAGTGGGAVDGRVSSQLRSVHALLRTAVQRFIDQQPRVVGLLQEVCEQEATRRTTRAGGMAAARHHALANSQVGAAARAQTEREVQRVTAVAAAGAAASHIVPAIPSSSASASAAGSSSGSAVSPAHSLPLSPHAQTVLDQLCSFPDLLANTLRADLPYSLSLRAWHAAVASQMHLLIVSRSTEGAAESASPPSAFLAPLSNLLTKMVRMGQSDVVLEAMCEPLLVHCRDLAAPVSASAVSASASAASSSASPSFVLSSPLLLAYASVFQGVGVQAQEKLVEGLLRWIGGRWKAIREEREVAMLDAREEQSKSSVTEAWFAAQGRAALSIFPSLFPLPYFESSPFFALLVSNRLFLARISLPSAALGVLVDYLWQMSLARLSLMGPQEATKTREAHQTLLDQVAVQVLQVWAGVGSGGSGVDSGTPSTAAVSGEAQLHLGKVVLLLLTKIEAELCGGAPAPKPRKAKKKGGSEAQPDAEIKSLGFFANSAAVSYLLSGIGSRLSSPLPPVRANAMQIAKVFSRLMGGAENELDFDEADAGEEEEEEEDPEQVAKRNQLATLTPASMINPAHLAGGGGGGAVLTTPSDGSPLQSHSLEDDERDLRKVPLPRFMRDAMDLIYKHADSFDHIEAALEALPGLIARNTPDLPTLARELTVALLNLGSNVFLETSPKLARWRLDSLVSLCSTYRLGDSRALADAVGYLISQFFSGNYSMGTKLEMLDVLRLAAERLAHFDGGGAEMGSTGGALKPTSGQPLIQEVSSSSARTASLVPINTPVYSSSSSAHAVSSTLAHHQAIIKARVEARTRRWGSTKIAAEAAAAGSSSAPAAPTARKYSINRFAPVSHLFFFPLMRQIDSESSRVHLSQHDGLLMLRLLHTVSGFIPCSSGLAQALPLATRNMARTLMEFLLVVGARTASASASAFGAAQGGTAEIGLRRMILFALSRILVCYNEALFADDFAREIPELVAWLTSAVQSDKDHECRQLAQANLYFLRQLLGDPFERLFKNEENNAAQAHIRASAQLPAIRF